MVWGFEIRIRERTEKFYRAEFFPKLATWKAHPGSYTKGPSVNPRGSMLEILYQPPPQLNFCNRMWGSIFAILWTHLRTVWIMNGSLIVRTINKSSVSYSIEKIECSTFSSLLSQAPKLVTIFVYLKIYKKSHYKMVLFFFCFV